MVFKKGMDFHYDRKNIGNARLWIGTVEDRADPLGLGRVRVRVHGYYTNEIETKQLPWATVLQNVTIGGVSAVGQSPVGLMVGAKVLGVWGDWPDCQMPVVLGILPQYEGSWSGSAFDVAAMRVMNRNGKGVLNHDFPVSRPAAFDYIGHYKPHRGQWNSQIVEWLRKTPGNPDDEVLWGEAFVRAVGGKIMKFVNPPRDNSFSWCIYVGSNRDRIYGVAAVSPTKVALAGFDAKRLVS